MVTAWDVLRGKEVGTRVVVAGGGIVGCETAEFLAGKGKKVTIVEKMPDIAQDLEPIRRALLRQRLAEHKVEIKVNSEIERIKGNNVIISDGEQITAETLVLALGVQPDRKLESLLRLCHCERTEAIFRVGDCDKPGNLLDAIHRAFQVAREL